MLDLDEEQDVHDRIAQILDDAQSLIEGQRRIESVLASLVNGQRSTSTMLATIHEDISGLPVRERGQIPTVVNKDDSSCEQAVTGGDLLGGDSPTLVPTPGLDSRAASRQVTPVPVEDVALGQSEADKISEEWPTNVPMRTGLESIRISSVSRACKDSDFLAGIMSSVQRTASDAGDTSTDPTSLRRQKESQCTTEPTSSVRIYWDLCSLCALVYDLINMPYTFAWDVEPNREATIIVFMFWTVDIMLNFRTGYWNHGVLVLNGRDIAARYLKQMFLPDLLLVLLDVLIFILNYISAGGSQAGFLKIARIAKVTRLIRILKLLRVAHMGEIIERVSDRYHVLSHLGIAGDICQIICIILWLNHVLACAWYGIGRINTSDTGSNWLDLSIGGDAEGSYRDADFWYQYFTSMHWSLTQMTPGSMQVFPLNSMERCMNIFCLIFGLLVFSSLVSSVTAKLTQVRMRMQDQISMLGTMNRFLRTSMISPQLAVRLGKQVQDKLTQRKQLTFKDVHALKLLSKGNSEELQLELCSPHLFHLPLFRVFAQVELRAIRRLSSEACEFVSYPTGEHVFLAGTEAAQAYVVTNGKLCYVQEPWSSNVEEETTTMVGVDRWVCEAALWCVWHHVGTLGADSGSADAMKLDADRFAHVMTRTHVTGELAKWYGRSFHKQLRSSKPPESDWPTDLVVPHTGYDEMVASAPLEIQTVLGLATIEILKCKASTWNFMAQASYKRQILENDVREGKSVLVLSETGDVERVAVVAVLQLTRQDGLMFTRLGKYRNGDCKPGCVMPGAKVSPGEGIAETLEKLVDNDLRPIAKMLRVYDVSTTEELKHSEKFGVKTKYIRHVHKATLDDSLCSACIPNWSGAESLGSLLPKAKVNEETAPQVQPVSIHHIHPAHPFSLRAHSFDRPQGQSACWGGPRDVFLVKSGDGSVLLYAWIRQEEVEFFGTLSGQTALSEWLSSLSVEDMVEAQTSTTEVSRLSNEAQDGTDSEIAI